MSVASSSDAPPTAPATMSTASSWMPTDPRPRKAPPPPQSPWVQATIQELRQLRRENQMLQELLEPGVLRQDDIATAAQLIGAAQGWRHQPKSSPNPKTQPLSVLRRPEGAVDVDATLSGPGQMPGNSAPPVLVDSPALAASVFSFSTSQAKGSTSDTAAEPKPTSTNLNHPPKAVFLNAVGAPMVPNTVMPKAAKPKPPVPPKCARDWLGGALFQ